MINDKLPYSLNDGFPSFHALATESTCDLYQVLAPIYLSTRKETLNHIDIGNPTNPYDYTDILKKIIVYANDVSQPFIRLIKEDYTISKPVPYPCDNTPGEINASINLEKWRAIASGRFSPIAYASTAGLLAGTQEFVGIDHTLYYCASGEFPYTESNFDIDIVLQNGDPTNIDYPGGVGYVLLIFSPDNPSIPNGSGAYFFAVHPKAKVKLKIEPN